MSDATPEAKLVFLSPDLIDEDPLNPNEMTEVAFQRLVESIEADGMIEAVTVVPKGDRYLLVGGEHRVRASKLLGLEQIPALVSETASMQDEKYRRSRMVRLNILRGKLDKHKFVAMMNEVADEVVPDDMGKWFGFADQSAWDKLVKSMMADLKASSIPKHILDDIAAKAAKLEGKKKSPEYLGKMIEKAMAKVAGVEHKSHVVVHGDGKSVVFDVPGKTVKVAEAIHGLAAAGVDIQGALHEALLSIVKKVNPPKVEPDEDPDEG